MYVLLRYFSKLCEKSWKAGLYSLLLFIFQDAYTFWTCSTQLPLWLLNRDINKFVQVEACRSTCLLVEKKCPFLIKDSEDDMASGNPSFICKGILLNILSEKFSILESMYFVLSASLRYAAWIVRHVKSPFFGQFFE